MRCVRALRARFHYRQQCSDGIIILGKQRRNLLNLFVHATEIRPDLQEVAELRWILSSRVAKYGPTSVNI